MKPDYNPITEELKRQEKETSKLKLELKKEVSKLAKATINNAKLKAYGESASNELEGDYGTWNDWKKLLEKFGNQIVDISMKGK